MNMGGVAMGGRASNGNIPVHVVSSSTAQLLLPRYVGYSAAHRALFLPLIDVESIHTLRDEAVWICTMPEEHSGASFPTRHFQLVVLPLNILGDKAWELKKRNCGIIKATVSLLDPE